MVSPLEYDANTVKEHKITPGIDLDETAKLAFARNQFEEIKKMLWRERTDLILAEAQAQDATDAVKAEVQSKIVQYKHNIGAYVKSLNSLKQLVDELDKRVSSEG